MQGSKLPDNGQPAQKQTKKDNERDRLLKQKVGSVDPQLVAQIAKAVDSSRLPGASTWLRELSLSLPLFGSFQFLLEEG